MRGEHSADRKNKDALAFGEDFSQKLIYDNELPERGYNMFTEDI